MTDERYARELSRDERGGFVTRVFGPASPASVRTARAVRKTIYPIVNLWRPTRRGIAFARRLFDPPITVPPVPGTKLSQRRIGGVPVEWTVSTRADEAEHRERVILYLHGGGFVFGSPRTHRNLVSRLSHVTATPAASVAYRMIPEATLTASQHDALAVYKGLIADGHRPESIVVAGDSAGGGLAAYVALAAVEQNLGTPAALILLSPWLDLGPGGPSRNDNHATEYFIAGDVLDRIARVLVSDRVTRESWPASPAAAPDDLLRALPPTLIQIGDGEILADDGRRFAERIGAAGGHAELQIYEGQAHVVAAWAGNTEARRALKEISGWLTASLPADREPTAPTAAEIDAATATPGPDMPDPRPGLFPG